MGTIKACSKVSFFICSLQIAALRDVSATETAIIYGLEPLWGAGFAWFLLGERWGTVGWIGAAFVLGKFENLKFSLYLNLKH